MNPAEASIIAGKYRLLRKLGQGAMGDVWQAEHLSLKSQIAIKFIQVDTALHADALTRFLREAQAAASLRSPHVVQILDHGVDDGVPYIAMELLEGESLAARLARVGRLEPREVSQILIHVGRAMARAHEAGIVHRDLKPDNIFLVRNDDEEIAKVLDFGIAKASDVDGLNAPVAAATRTGAVMGTPYYMSPEQTEGAKGVDVRADIWSLGVIAFECLLGRRPFDAETLGGLLLAICTKPMPTPSELGSVPAGFDAWFAHACARDLSQRFASAKEATQELRRVCDDGAPARGPNSIWPAASATAAPDPQLRSVLNDSSGLAGQLAEGFSSTQAEPSSAPPSVAKRISGLGLFALGVLSLAAVLLAWFLFHGRVIPLGSPTSVLPSAGSGAMTAVATPAPPPEAPAAVSLRASPTLSASAAGTSSASPPRNHGEHPVLVTPKPREASSAAPWPGKAGSVNLGI